MSRVGKKHIILPEKVTAEVSGGLIVVKGPKGELSWRLPQGIGVVKTGEALKLEADSAALARGHSAVWGTARSLVANMVAGVAEGYEKKLELEGIGFKAQAQGNKLIVSIGFSHPVEFEAPAGVSLKVEKNVITVSGADKILVGRTAAKIRALKKPEPYKGKGIRYAGEVIRRKAGKKATAGA